MMKDLDYNYEEKVEDPFYAKYFEGKEEEEKEEKKRKKRMCVVRMILCGLLILLFGLVFAVLKKSKIVRS